MDESPDLAHLAPSLEPPADAPIEETAPPSSEGVLREYLESLLVTIILAVFGTTFLVQAFKIPSPSMVPALLVGDHLLVNKFIFGGDGAWYDRFLPYRAIQRGDVIVFKYPYEDHPYYVKRVIGLPGDRIRILDQRVYVNDVELNEPYIVHDLAAADLYMADFPPTDLSFIDSEITPRWAAELPHDIVNGELLVPPRDYFVMGDNRDHSADSRYWGFVPRDAIVGAPLFVYWSVKATAADYNPSSLAQEWEDTAKSIFLFPVHTRWNRIFHEVH